MSQKLSILATCNFHQRALCSLDKSMCCSVILIQYVTCHLPEGNDITIIVKSLEGKLGKWRLLT